MKELLKEIIAGNQNRLPAEVKPRAWEVPADTGKVVTIPGVRRCGKSSHFALTQNGLLRRGVPKERILSLNLDDERLDFSDGGIGALWDAYAELYPGIRPNEAYLFLDEIQAAAGWERFVRRIYDGVSKNVYITGSNSKMLSSEIATALRGRTLQFEIFPLSFPEYCDFKGIEKNVYDPSVKAGLINAFNDYLFKGGFPEIALGKEVFLERILQEYYHVMIFKDLVERYGVKNTKALRYLVKRLLAGLTKPTSVNKIFNELKSGGLAISKNTIYELVDELESIYMFLPLPKFCASAVKEFSGMPKHYVIDNGFNYTLQGPVSENRGAFLENAVYLCLRRLHPFGNGLFYFKEKYECDFLRTEKQSVTELIQVCWSLDAPETEKREVNGLLEAARVTGCKNLKIITADTEKRINSDGAEISVLPAWKFMLRESVPA
jgi:predicted AAA+ superfamily ATPase